MGAVDDIAVGDLAVGSKNGLRHLEHVLDHERGGILLLGKANLGGAKLRHASGLDNTGLRVPMGRDPQRDRVKTGAERFNGAVDKRLRRVQGGTAKPADGERIRDREQGGNRFGEIAGQAENVASLRRTHHR